MFPEAFADFTVKLKHVSFNGLGRDMPWNMPASRKQRFKLLREKGRENPLLTVDAELRLNGLGLNGYLAAVVALEAEGLIVGKLAILYNHKLNFTLLVQNELPVPLLRKGITII
jgi:hypothetical protein